MKIILNESRLKSVFSKFLEKSKINIHLEYYGSDVNDDGLIIKGLVRLSQGDTPRNVERIGYSLGYIFSFKKKDNELILRKTSPDITEIGGIFKGFPPDLILDYFSELIKEFLYKKLEQNK
jgi:hypothetical protein